MTIIQKESEGLRYIFPSKISNYWETDLSWIFLKPQTLHLEQLCVFPQVLSKIPRNFFSLESKSNEAWSVQGGVSTEYTKYN